MRILIAASCYADTVAMCEVIRLWAKTTLALNPDLDILLIDSASPFRPQHFLAEILAEHGHRFHLHDFGDNIGHLSRGGGNGAGRALAKGIETAIEAGYDYVFCTEADLLLARPVQPVFDEMATCLLRALSCPSGGYQFVETGLLFFDVRWLKAARFPERYAWDKPLGNVLPEIHLKRICGGDLLLLPWCGLRDDLRQLTSQNLRQQFPHGIDWLTHVGGMDVFCAFLRLNGLEP